MSDEKKVDPGQTGVSKTTEVTKDVDYEVDSAGRRPTDPGYTKPVNPRPGQDLPPGQRPADPNYGQDMPARPSTQPVPPTAPVDPGYDKPSGSEEHPIAGQPLPTPPSDTKPVDPTKPQTPGKP